MIHLFKYHFIQRIRCRDSMFWALMFPIVLGTLFYLAFGKNSGELELADTIPVAVVQESEDAVFQEYMETVQDEMNILEVKFMELDEAKKELEKGEIEGIFFMGTNRRLEVAESSINTTILKVLLDNYNKNEALVKDVAMSHPEKLEQVLANIENENMIADVSLGGETMNVFIQYFFALMAMACLFGCNIGFDTGLSLQANQSLVGARISVVPVSRFRMIFSGFLTSFILQFGNVLITFAYIKFVLKMYMGNDVAKILLVCLVGSTFGVALGILIASVGKIGNIAKSMILTGVSLFSSFLAGLMNEKMRGMVEQTCPIINRINPGTLISDAFYCITVYDSPKRYAQNLITLSIMATVLVIVSFLAVRRVRYESI